MEKVSLPPGIAKQDIPLLLQRACTMCLPVRGAGRQSAILRYFLAFVVCVSGHTGRKHKQHNTMRPSLGLSVLVYRLPIRPACLYVHHKFRLVSPYNHRHLARKTQTPHSPICTPSDRPLDRPEHLSAPFQSTAFLQLRQADVSPPQKSATHAAPKPLTQAPPQPPRRPPCATQAPPKLHPNPPAREPFPKKQLPCTSTVL